MRNERELKQIIDELRSTDLFEGAIAKLHSYLQRHPEMEEQCSKGGHLAFYTTGDASDFDEHAAHFFGGQIKSSHLQL